jgi:hypothetical protein
VKTALIYLSDAQWPGHIQYLVFNATLNPAKQDHQYSTDLFNGIDIAKSWMKKAQGAGRTRFRHGLQGFGVARGTMCIIEDFKSQI